MSLTIYVFETHYLLSTRLTRVLYGKKTVNSWCDWQNLRNFASICMLILHEYPY